MVLFFNLGAVCTILQILIATPTASQRLPVIDLDYNLQSPTAYHSDHDIYVFYDIRYAAPPTGNNRFRAPQPPATDRSSIQRGGTQWVCASTIPRWQLMTQPFFAEYQEGKTVFAPSDFGIVPGVSLTPTDPKTTEDCLFLDIYATKAAVDNAVNGDGGVGVPVIVQIYGGGYITGAKNIDPSGFFMRDREQAGPGLIFVSFNYRLGAFGWLGGADFQKDGDANAGFLDQRFALEWVQKYISRFGGNPKNVTVMGESAGGGSILHQITAYGGSPNYPPATSSLFQKAIIQSPGFRPIDEDQQNEQTFYDFLKWLGVDTIEEARQKSFLELFAANANQISGASYGQFVYGPTVDGIFVPDLPSRLLADGAYDHNIAIMVGHNSDEGIAFTWPFVQNDNSFEQDVGSWFPPAMETSPNLQYLAGDMYPALYDGRYGYTNPIARAAVAVGEYFINCNTYYLNKAFGNYTFAYLFDVPPGTHGTDMKFTYYNGPSNDPNPDVQVALNMQRHFLHFAHWGNPNGFDVEPWYYYGNFALLKSFDRTLGFRMVKETTQTYRCDWYQDNLAKARTATSNFSSGQGGSHRSAAPGKDAMMLPTWALILVSLFSLYYYYY